MTLVLLTRQIGHYHDARYRAAVAALGKIAVISTANEGGFREFLAHESGHYPVVRLFADMNDYWAAVHAGRVVQVVADALEKVSATAVAVAGWAAPESGAAILCARRRGIPVILLSDSQNDDGVRSPIREFTKRRIVAQCDAALVGGPPHCHYVVELGMPAERVVMGYDVVCNAHFAEGADSARADPVTVRAAHGLPERYLLASARFIRKKNLTALVRAYAAAVADEIATPDLVILGDGEMRGLLEETIALCGVQARVHLSGFRGYDVLPAYYGLAEGFCHVSLKEQWGLVINEAMASGIPIIASRSCGATRTVMRDGTTGYVVDPEDETDIAGALSRLMALSTQERAVMGAAARAAIADWGPRRFGSGISAAVAAASAAPRKVLAPWDGMILQRLSRTRVTSAVT